MECRPINGIYSWISTFLAYMNLALKNKEKAGGCGWEGIIHSYFYQACHGRHVLFVLFHIIYFNFHIFFGIHTLLGYFHRSVLLHFYITDHSSLPEELNIIGNTGLTLT